MHRSRSLLVAWLIALATLAACTDANEKARPDAAASSTTSSPATTIPTTAAPATTLMPPAFKARAAAETREEEWRNIPGSASRECVDVEKFQHLARQIGSDPRNTALELRSGEWIAGSFYDLKHRSILIPADAPGGPTYQLKIYWIGLARDIQSPIITARSLSNPTQAPVRGDSGTASNASGLFTVSGVEIPSPGRWRITAASTDQWGCYDVEL